MKNVLRLLPVLSMLMLAACAETQFGASVAKSAMKDTKSQGAYKVGNPYLIEGQEYYPRESFDYTETGIASWYGPGFHAKQTANGEKFDQHELTAAHRTLQMPSLVRVTNLENGRSVVLRVNDRGPFARGRIIDVSQKGAELLGFKNKGTAKVRVETLPAESRRIAEHAKAGMDTRGYEVALNNNPRPANPNQPVTLYPDRVALSVQTDAAADTMGAAKVASVEAVQLPESKLEPVQGHISSDGRFMPNPVVTQQPIPAGGGNVYVQAGAFGDSANAERLSARMAAYGPSRVYHVNIGGRDFYRVRLGPYNTIPAADSALNQVLTAGTNNAMIVVD